MSASAGSETYASIDIGSHTIRILIARLGSDGNLIPLAVDRRITRLAAGFADGEILKETGIAASIAALREFAGLPARHGADAVVCGATGVVRRAKNGREFLDRVESSTGICASILSEDAEARLSAKGVLSVLPARRGFVLTFDLGGSSTEFFLAEIGRDEPLYSASVFIGAALLTQACLRGDPPAANELERAVNAARDAVTPTLANIEARLKDVRSGDAPFEAVGTAGTATTLAAMCLQMRKYEPYRINGTVLTEKWLSETIDLLARSPIAVRRNMPGLESGREDIILGGAVIVREIIAGLHRSSFLVTDGGLLEGLLLDFIEKRLGRLHASPIPLTWRFQKG